MLTPGRFTFAIHEASTECPFSHVLIMRAAQELDPLHRSFASARELQLVIELEIPFLFTPMARVAHERASALVTPPHRALDARGDRARAARRPPRGTGLLGGGELVALELSDQRVEGEVHEQGELGGR